MVKALDVIGGKEFSQVLLSLGLEVEVAKSSQVYSFWKRSIQSLLRNAVATPPEIHALRGKMLRLLRMANLRILLSFQSNNEVHQTILQQVGAFLRPTSSQLHDITLQFLQPFITFVFMQPMTSLSNVLFARELHAKLSLHCSHLFSELLLRELINCIQLYEMDNAQGRQFATAAANEVVGVWESLVDRDARQRSKAKALEELGSQLVCTLIGVCHELLSYGESFQFTLTGVKRMIELLRPLSQQHVSSLTSAMVSLAQMLAMVDLEQEQLLLLDLGAGWVNDIYAQQSNRDVMMPPGRLVLCWVFPALHVMSYPSLAVKGAAARLLRTLETLSLEEKVWGVSYIPEDLVDWGKQHLTVIICRILRQMSSKEDTSSNFFKCLTASTMTPGTSREHWLKSIIILFDRDNQSSQALNLTSTRLELSKGLIVSTCTLVTVCLMDSLVTIALLAAKAVTLIAKNEPIWAMSLLPVALFCIKYQGRRDRLAASQIQLAILKVLPSLARHNTTLPLVLQVLQPMLDPKSDVGMRTTAVRLLCKTWEFSDRAFLHLQKLVGPGDVEGIIGGIELHQSRAACIRDVSRKDPDRAVDLVSSVQVCIESEDPVVVSLGLQSLARLCEEDLIDFYTAWVVISKRFSVLPSNPHVLKSLCMLLRYGNLDAAAYPDAAATILSTLWIAAKTKKIVQNVDIYSTARALSFEAISSYEVNILDDLCPSVRDEEVDLLLSESSRAAQHSLETLLIKTLAHDHKERQRGQKEAKVIVGKVEKLLKVFPGALNANEFPRTSGRTVTSVSDYPGAALLCFTLPVLEKTEKISTREYLKSMKTWQINQEKIFLEVADQLYIGGNLVLAIIALQSWSSFVLRWLHTISKFYETDHPELGQDERLLKAAKYLMKLIKKSCEDEVPRVAENGTLALAALCKVMPVRAHGICEEVSVFLESRLLQEDHEYMQWSATLALGTVATCLHTTDWSLKSKIVHLLVKYASTSDRGVVRGACGLALGMICQSLLQQGSTTQVTGAIRQRETKLLEQVFVILMQLTSETCPNAASAIRKLSGLLRTGVIERESVATSPFIRTGETSEEDNLWATVGFVWGLGISVTGLSQLQNPLLLSTLTDLMISWVSLSFEEDHVDSLDGFMTLSNSEMLLAAGACLALPTCLDVCAKLELFSVEANVLLQRVASLVHLATERAHSTRMADCWPTLLCLFYLGSGNVLGTILQDGGQSIKVELIQTLLASVQTGVELQDPGGWAIFGATFGIANMLGAGAAFLGSSARNQQILELRMISRIQVRDNDHSLVSKPLLFEATQEEYVAGIIRGFIVAVRDEHRSHLKVYAAWALAFIHDGYYRSVELDGRKNSLTGEVMSAVKEPRQSGYHMRSLQDLPEKSVLRLLCTKLMNQKRLDRAATLLRCLEKAHRLPALDWGGIIRRLWRQPRLSSESNEDVHHLEVIQMRSSELNSSPLEGRQQCILFAIAHAEQVPALASFIDELCELSRLGTLESSLRNLLMCHLFNLKRIFSPLRLKQLLSDVQELASNPAGLSGSFFEGGKGPDFEANKFRVSLWTGLVPFLEDSSSGLHEDVNDEGHKLVEECILTLVNLLSTGVMWGKKSPEDDEKEHVVDAAVEWTAAVATLTKAKRAWLLQALEVPSIETFHTQSDFDSSSRAVFARCQLVVTRRLSISDLIVCRRWLLSCCLSDVATLLVEVAWAAKEASQGDRRDWLLDAVDTAFISPYLATFIFSEIFEALKFHSNQDIRHKFPSFSVLDTEFVENLAIVLASLLATCWSSDSPLLKVDPLSALEDFHFTIPSILEGDGWGFTRERISVKLTALLDKLRDKSRLESEVWMDLEFSNGTMTRPRLFSVLRRTCIALNQYLPFDSRIELVNSRIIM